MNIGAPDLPRGWLVLGLFLALLATIGCSGKKPKDAQNDDRKSTAASEHLDGGTYCVQTISQGPPVSQPVHFSNKQSESDGSSKDFESDLSSDKFDITFRERHRATSDDKPGSTPAVDNEPIHVPARTVNVADGYAELVQVSHYVRSNDHDWNMGATTVAQGGSPWGLFINKPPVTQVGTETISGYETTKYAVDTIHQSQLEKSPGLIGGQLKDYNIVGTAWVAKQGTCVLQYQIDYEEDAKDGTVRKVHYEGSITK